MKVLNNEYKKADNDEDRALWREQILNLQEELFDGEELAKEREKALADEARLQEERDKEARLAA